jgi:hypothetical protein
MCEVLSGFETFLSTMFNLDLNGTKVSVEQLVT